MTLFTSLEEARAMRMVSPELAGSKWRRGRRFARGRRSASRYELDRMRERVACCKVATDGYSLSWWRVARDLLRWLIFLPPASPRPKSSRIAYLPLHRGSSERYEAFRERSSPIPKARLSSSEQTRPP